MSIEEPGGYWGVSTGRLRRCSRDSYELVTPLYRHCSYLSPYCHDQDGSSRRSRVRFVSDSSRRHLSTPGILLEVRGYQVYRDSSSPTLVLDLTTQKSCTTIILSPDALLLECSFTDGNERTRAEEEQLKQRTTTLMEEKSGEALKRTALLLAEAVLLATTTGVTALSPLVTRFEDRTKCLTI